MTDKEIILALGGPTKVAALLGFAKGGSQRVQNWMARGIPSDQKLARPDLFLAHLMSRKAREEERRQAERRQAERREKERREAQRRDKDRRTSTTN